MNGTIYDFRALPLPSFDPPAMWRHPSARGRDPMVVPPALVGVITNPRSRHNRGNRHLADPAAQRTVLAAAPATRAELRNVLASYARQAVDLLVVDGGDGTVRDVLTCAEALWGDRWPLIAVLPSGKTNALAMDLGVPADWTLTDVLAAMRRSRTVQRSPLEITRRDAPERAVRGFLFGAGAFVNATQLAQHTHKAGLFNGVSVAMALGLGVTSTLFGGASSPWRKGSRMALHYGPRSVGMHGVVPDGDDQRYLMLASTLQRLPAGMKPFGTPRPGLKTLVIDAPPRRVVANLLPLLTGSESPFLEEFGYHRADADWIDIDVDSSFILDGELFPAGGYGLRRAAPLRFLVP